MRDRAIRRLDGWMFLLIVWMLLLGMLAQKGWSSDITTAIPVQSKSNRTTDTLSHQVRTAFKVQTSQQTNVHQKQVHFPGSLLKDELLERPLVAVSQEPSILSPTDMPGDMLTFASETAIKAVSAFTSVADMAEYLRMKFEARFPSTSTGNWQTSVGTNFAASIRKRTGTGFYAKVKGTFILIFASP
ncbi:hypothetical protein BV898_04094 [Hypsibius exemplaris]|uniref:Uncharacterized protein n=1 Tax=Hypsibius exemplaris TaxID=2072580 RepID=A0A1W0X378_HYPEX|nr:hypothetical protein BV898_04094 [Hypsibius exemplaris]